MPVREMRDIMATKAIENLTNLINEKYSFVDSDGAEMKLYTSRQLHGYEIYLKRTSGDQGIGIIYTQYEQVPAKVAVLILKMLFHDILERQNLKHYSVIKRV